MEAEKSSGLFLYDIMKVELEEIDENERDISSYFNNSSDDQPAELVFSDAEVSKDPRTGLSVCMLCLEDLMPGMVTDHMVKVHKYRKIFFKCWNCEEIFQERSHLTHHRKTCQPRDPVKKKLTIRQLIRATTEQYNASVCPICLVEVGETLKDHFDKEHKVSEAQGPMNCPICNKSFKSKMSLRQHRRYVHKTNKDPVECHECGKKFASQNLLTNHKRNVHPNDGKIHTCEECGKGYKSHQSLYQHIKYVHTSARLKKNKKKCDD